MQSGETVALKTREKSIKGSMLEALELSAVPHTMHDLKQGPRLKVAINGPLE